MARASMTLCAGGALLGNSLPARPLLLFIPRPALQPQTRAVHLPEDVLPPDAQVSEELLIVRAEMFRSIMEAAEAGSTGDAQEACFVIAGLARERFKSLPPETSDEAEPSPLQAMAAILEEQARELTRAGQNEIAAVLMAMCGAINGDYLREFATYVVRGKHR